MKVSVEQPEMLLALQLAQISAHIPVGTSGSVAVAGLLLLQRNMRTAMSSKTLSGVVFPVGIPKDGSATCEKEKEHYTYALK